MDLQVTSPRIRFLDTTGFPIDRPHEWREALVEVLIDPDDWVALRLTINRIESPVSLRSLDGQVRVLADWPRANAGSYELRAELRDRVFIRRVQIEPGKLSQESFSELLYDLENRLPAAIAIALQRSGGLAGLAILPPQETTVAQEFARLKRAINGSLIRPGLATTLREIARDPHEILQSEELWADVQRARRPHPSRLIHAVRSPHNTLDGKTPLKVIDSRVKASTDVYENRLVRMFHDQVLLRVLRLEKHCSRAEISGDLSAELQELRNELSRARLEAQFLDDVQVATHLPTSVSMVLLKRPAYRAAFEGYLELHRSLAVRLEEPGLDLPLENLPHLYQVWGTLVVCAALLDSAVEFGYQLEFQRLVSRTHNEMFVRMVPAGRAAIRLVHPTSGTTVTLSPEHSYTSTGQIRSVSFTQVPDISITTISRDGARRLLLLDPKYKLDSDNDSNPATDGRPKKVDIDKMHAYRDAIRNPEGNRLVDAAYTIYPGPPVNYSVGLGALSGVPGNDSLYKEVRSLISNYLEMTLYGANIFNGSTLGFD